MLTEIEFAGHRDADTLGGALLYCPSPFTGLLVRHALHLSTCKTVDDHCGYSVPFDK
jgi:hypothetical protein